MASYIDLMRTQHEKTNRLERELSKSLPRDPRNEPSPPTELVQREIDLDEKIHGEKFVQPRDYVTLGLKDWQARFALEEITDDAAFNLGGRGRAALALKILTSEKALYKPLRDEIEKLLDEA